MSEVSFVALGGANSIGKSCYVLKFPGYTVAVDWGAGPHDEDGEGVEPVVQGHIDAFFITHGHRDHVGMVPRIQRYWPDAKIWLTFETARLARWMWKDELYVSGLKGRPVAFTEGEIEKVVQTRLRVLRVGHPVSLTDELTVTACSAGHILGAVMYVFTYRGASYVVTGDMCMDDHTFIQGARVPVVENCALLVRESTYVGQYCNASRSEVKASFTEYVAQVLAGGGQLIVPALSIDRLPEMWVTLHAAGIEPLWVIGGKEPSNIYQELAPGGKVLGHMRRFTGRQARFDCAREMSSGRPMVILASSGMVAEGTPSYDCALRVLGNPRSAICFVNYQGLGTPGRAILDSAQSDVVVLPDASHPRRCDIRKFQCTTHAMEGEMTELEELLRPGRVIHVHGEDEKIQAFIHSDYGRRCQRHKALVGQEIQL